MSTLTREVIDAAEGRSLDALIAEYLFGWKGPVVWSDPVDEDDTSDPYLFPPGTEAKYIEANDRDRDCRVPEYAEDIELAWSAVVNLAAKYHWSIRSPFAPGESYWAGLTPHNVTGWNGKPDMDAQGATGPIAIFRAALYATLEEAAHADQG